MLRPARVTLAVAHAAAAAGEGTARQVPVRRRGPPRHGWPAPLQRARAGRAEWERAAAAARVRWSRPATTRSRREALPPPVPTVPERPRSGREDVNETVKRTKQHGLPRKRLRAMPVAVCCDVVTSAPRALFCASASSRTASYVCPNGSEWNYVVSATTPGTWRRSGRRGASRRGRALRNSPHAWRPHHL